MAILGTAGHVDHGKSTLIEALTGIHPDRLPEEKKRGMSIELGFGTLTLPSGRSIGVVDVPGHERFVRAMAAGVHAMDLVLFVIAANEGIKPQTLEHRNICSLMGIKHGLIVLTKADLMNDQDWPSLEKNVETFCQNSFLDQAPRLRVSAQTKAGLPELIQAIDQLLPGSSKSSLQGPFRLWIDRAFTLKGIGEIVTGTAQGNEIETQTSLEILPPHSSATCLRVKRIQMHGETVTKTCGGNRTALNVTGMDLKDLALGKLLALPHTTCSGKIFLARLHLLGKMKQRSSAQLLMGTASAIAKITLLEKKIDDKSETYFARLILDRPLPLIRGEHFILRNFQPLTLAGGIILDPQPQFRTKTSNHALALSQALDQQDESLAVKTFFQLRGSYGLHKEEILPWLIAPAQTKTWLDEHIHEDAFIPLGKNPTLYLTDPDYQKLRQQILDEIEKHEINYPLTGGIAYAELVSKLQEKSFLPNHKIYEAIIERELNRESFSKEGNHLFLKKPGLESKHSEIAIKILEIFRRHEIQPPSVKSVRDMLQIPEKKLLDLLTFLCREKKLTKVGEEYYYDAQILGDLIQKVTDFLNHQGQVNVQDFKSLTGVTRKHAIPLLEYFDREKITLRVGEVRVLRKKVPA